MRKNKDYISPTQINKFINCKYKWYYEKIYTNKELSALYKEYKEENGITDNKQFVAFAKGNKFHANYLKKQRRKELFHVFLTTSAILGGFALCLLYFLQ